MATLSQEEIAKDADARDDLRRIEQEAVMEAETTVEFDDAVGLEQEAAEAAETAFQFDEAQK